MHEPPELAEEPPPREDQVRAEAVRQLYGALPGALGVSTIVAALLVIALWPAVSHPLLIGWLLIHLVVSGGRLVLLRAYRNQAPAAAAAGRWQHFFLAGTLLAGCVWGAAGVVLFPAGDPLGIAILLVTLSGITAGAVTSLSAHWPTALAFIAPTMSPFLIRVIGADLAYSLAVAVLVGLFLAGMGYMSRRIADNVHANIRLRMIAEERKEALTKYRAAFEQSRDAVMFLDRQGFVDCNPATLALFQVPDVATFTTYHPADLSPPRQPDGRPSREAADARIREAFAKGQAFFEWHHQTAEGETFPAEVLLSRVDLHPQPVLQGVARDVSERKAFEETLRREEASLKEAQRIGQVGSWVWDMQAGTLSWSDEVYRIFGAEPQSFGATYEAFLDLVHPDDRDTVDHQVRQALAGEIRYDLEHRIRTPDGEERTVHERAEVERNAAGQPIRMVGTVQDTSQRAAAERALRRRADQEATVQHISTEVLGASGEALDATVADALARIGATAEADRCYLFRVAEDGATMSNIHEWCAPGIPPHIQQRQELPTADFPWLLEQLKQRETIPVSRVTDLPEGAFRSSLESGEIQSLLLVPLVVGDRVVGFLGLDAVEQPRFWSEADQHLLRITADALANAFARQDLESRLRHQASHDALTGLFNRREFEKILERETERADRYGRNLSLAMLDLDRFKAINDTHGHHTGDRVLREVTERVAHRLRGPDVLARWGGEEFMALLPETSEADACEVAEAVRAEVAGADFPEVGRVTVSLGVAEYRYKEPIKDLTKRADDALYRAKKAGRNRVATASEKAEVGEHSEPL